MCSDDIYIICYYDATRIPRGMEAISGRFIPMAFVEFFIQPIIRRLSLPGTPRLFLEPTFFSFVNFSLYATGSESTISRMCPSQEDGLNILRLNSETACTKYPGQH